MTEFAYPIAFVLLIVPYLIRRLLPAVKGLHGDALRVPFLNDIKKISIQSGEIWQVGGKDKGISVPLLLLYLVWILLVTALARPQWVGEPVRVKNFSRDILLVTDISQSMLEDDFSYRGRRLNRLNAVKAVVSDFIEKRPDDRIGLILFGSRAYLQAPITYDKKSVTDILRQTDAGMAGNSTAIGDALGLALKTLRETGKPDEKIIILLTDGENNDGSLSLAQAIDLAKKENIKVYTIGVGAGDNFMVAFMGLNPAGSGLDEKGLRELAAETKGRYFRATDLNSLAQVYEAINKLEPTENDSRFVRESREYYYIPLLAAVLLAAGLVVLTRRRK